MINFLVVFSPFLRCFLVIFLLNYFFCLLFPMCQIICWLLENRKKWKIAQEKKYNFRNTVWVLKKKARTISLFFLRFFDGFLVFLFRVLVFVGYFVHQRIYFAGITCCWKVYAENYCYCYHFFWISESVAKFFEFYSVISVGSLRPI